MTPMTHNQNTILNSTVDFEFEDIDIARLTKTMSSIKRLVLRNKKGDFLGRKLIGISYYLEGGVPPQVNKNHVITCCQIQPYRHSND